MVPPARCLCFLGGALLSCWVILLGAFSFTDLPETRRGFIERNRIRIWRRGSTRVVDIFDLAAEPQRPLNLLVYRSAVPLERMSNLEEVDGDGLDVGKTKSHSKHGKGGREEAEHQRRSGRTPSEARAAAQKLIDNIHFVDDSTRLITHLRQFVVWNATLQKPVLRHYLEYFDEQTNTTIPYTFPKDLLDLIPVEEPVLDYETCALVGNSGVSLLHNDGPEIDAHDAVFRMNLAPVRGFEDHVGSHTTFQIVNSPNIREMLTGSLQWRTNDNTTRLVMFETATQFARYHLAGALLEEHGNRALLLNPGFANHCHKTWMTLKESLEFDTGNTFHKKPMSGFFAAMMALQVCNHVDLYGFDAYTSSRVQGFTDVHSFDLAMHIFQKVGERGLLTIKS